MKYTITGKDVNDLMYDYNIRLKDTELYSETIIDKPNFGKIQIENRQINGFNLIELNAVLDKPIEIKNSNGCGENMFALYFNLGKLIGSTLNNKNNDIKPKSHNIWSFSGDEKGTVSYKPKDINRTFSIVFEQTYLKELVVRYPELLSKIYDAHTNNLFNRWGERDFPINNEMNQILYQIQNAHLMGQYRFAYTEAKILELLVLQLNCPHKEACCLEKFCKSSSDINKMHEARSFLLQNIENPPNICELSKKVGINEHKLKNGFKEVFNQTVYGYLFEHRMEIASQLLLDTDKTIFEIALDCGYEYSSHFTTAFKRRFGVSPKAFRERRLVRI